MPLSAAPPRLAAQLDFILEVDRLKTTLRQTQVSDRSRRENSAEHSWHLALMAALLAEQSNTPVDVLHVLKMLLIHDVVEIDAGDTFCYDAEARLDKEERERGAADRLFGLLPRDQAQETRALWDEFEEGETPEARLAIAMDRLQPLLLNYRTEGGTWRQHGVRRDQVMERMRPVADASTELWELVQRVIDSACDRGWISPAPARME